MGLAREVSRALRASGSSAASKPLARGSSDRSAPVSTLLPSADSSPQPPSATGFGCPVWLVAALVHCSVGWPPMPWLSWAGPKTPSGGGLGLMRRRQWNCGCDADDTGVLSLDGRWLGLATVIAACCWIAKAGQPLLPVPCCS